MKNKIKFLIFVIILLVLNIITVYAATDTLCSKTFGDKGYSCQTGKLGDLKNKGLDCKAAGSCEGTNCCGSSANSYCCGPSLCEQNYDGYKCVSGIKSELENKNSYKCKSATDCEGGVCCGPATNLYCCPSETGTQATPTAFDFLSIPGVPVILQSYETLKVPPEITYYDLQKRSTSGTVQIKALYDEANGFKQIAQLRREYIGLPINVILQQESGKIVKESGVNLASTVTQTAVLNNQVSVDLTGESCGTEGYVCALGTVDDLEGKGYTCSESCNEKFTCCKAPADTKSISTSTQDKQTTTTKGSNAIILKAASARDIRVAFTDKWQWCQTTTIGNACSGSYKDLSSIKNIWFAGDKYTKIVKDLPDANYEEGIKSILLNLAYLQFEQNFKMPIDIEQKTDNKNNYVAVLLILNQQKDSIDIKVGNKIFNNALSIGYQEVLAATAMKIPVLKETNQLTAAVKAIKSI